MQVFVVLEWIGYEKITVRKVFSSRKKAEDFIEKQKVVENFEIFHKPLD